MAGTSFTEDILDVVVALLETHQPELQVGGNIADHVVDPVIAGIDLDQLAPGPGVQAGRSQGQPHPLLGITGAGDLDQQEPCRVGELRGRGRTQQATAV
jgi:hypothetical protein